MELTPHIGIRNTHTYVQFNSHLNFVLNFLFVLHIWLNFTKYDVNQIDATAQFNNHICDKMVTEDGTHPRFV